MQYSDAFLVLRTCAARTRLALRGGDEILCAKDIQLDKLGQHLDLFMFPSYRGKPGASGAALIQSYMLDEQSSASERSRT